MSGDLLVAKYIAAVENCFSLAIESIGSFNCQDSGQTRPIYKRSSGARARATGLLQRRRPLIKQLRKPLRLTLVPSFAVGQMSTITRRKGEFLALHLENRVIVPS